MESSPNIAQPLCLREEDFTPEEAVEILRSSSSEVQCKIISIPPCKPKAGEAYLFKPDSVRYASKFL